MIKYLVLFLVFFASIAINMSSGYLNHLGLDPNILIVALIAVVITALTVRRRLFFVVLVVLMSIGANLPDTTIQSIGIERDILLAGLISMVLVPYVLGVFGYEE